MDILSVEFISSYQGEAHYRIWPRGAEPFRVAAHEGRVMWTESPSVVAALQARHDKEWDATAAKYPDLVHLMSPRVSYYLAN